MRIVAGIFKGRTVDSVPGDSTRPTTDKVREAVASSMISNRDGGFEGAVMLDAFAGSGAVGIEGLSRGAISCTFVDVDQKAIRTIEGNLAKLPLDGVTTKVIKTNILAATPATIPGGPFDIVFLDPPYAIESSEIATFLQSIARNGDLAAGAIVGYEKAGKKGQKRKIPKGEVPDDVRQMADTLGGLFDLVNVKYYGTTQVVYFRYIG